VSRVVEFMHPSRKEGSKEKRSTRLKMATGVGKTHPKTTTLHPRLPTSKNLSPITFKPKAKLEITKGFKNNYPHYRYP
jgi:hypothetical protein